MSYCAAWNKNGINFGLLCKGAQKIKLKNSKMMGNCWAFFTNFFRSAFVFYTKRSVHSSISIVKYIFYARVIHGNSIVEMGSVHNKTSAFPGNENKQKQQLNEWRKSDWIKDKQNREKFSHHAIAEIWAE